VATSVSRPAGGSASRIAAGVAPLRAGQGRSFLLRRLHSLSGLFPVGAFLLEHFISNTFATNGLRAYTDEVKFLTGIPFLVFVEVGFIYIPILYHALYGFYIWYRGESNVGDYPFIGNWGYMVQRWTGGIAFFYIVWHTITMRWIAPHIVGNPGVAFPKVQMELAHPWSLAAYIVGIVCASVHFGYGIWLFAAKWGLTTGPKSRKRFAYVCALICLGFIFMGFAALYSFRKTPQLPLPAADHPAEQALLNR